MINGGIDVYKALLNIPKSDSERVNAELFRKYFNKPAVTSFPVPIKHAIGTVEAKFSIYEEGDVFVEFGKSSQWFPFPKEKSSSVAVEVIQSAFAQDKVSPRGIGRYQQNDQMDGSAIIRQKTYENGVKETQRIDIRTGQITEQNISGSATQDANRDLSPFGVIDLEVRKQSQSKTATPASVCMSKLGTCSMLVPIQKGAACYCYAASGPTPGIAR